MVFPLYDENPLKWPVPPYATWALIAANIGAFQPATFTVTNLGFDSVNNISTFRFDLGTPLTAGKTYALRMSGTVSPNFDPNHPASANAILDITEQALEGSLENGGPLGTFLPSGDPLSKGTAGGDFLYTFTVT